MNKLTLSLALLVSVMLSGCASQQKPVRTTYCADGTVVESTLIDSATELGQAYYNQPNTAQLINAEGTNITWSITGCTSLVFSVPVPPKQIVPRESSWYNGVADTLKTYAPWFFMAYWVHEGGFGNTTTKTVTTTGN